MSGGTYGVEPFVDWKALRGWRLFGSYSYLAMNIHKNSDSSDPTADLPEGINPEHQFYFRSSLELPKHIEQNLVVRHVTSLSTINVPGYSSLDGGLRWSPIPTLEVSFQGDNWLNSRHTEFAPDFVNTLPTVVGRSFNVSVTWTSGKR
jgi:iron complex outermembrane recepter protein